MTQNSKNKRPNRDDYIEALEQYIDESKHTRTTLEEVKSEIERNTEAITDDMSEMAKGRWMATKIAIEIVNNKIKKI